MRIVPRIYYWLLARRRWVWGTLGLLTAVAIWLGTHLNLSEDISALLPADDPIIDEHQAALSQFRQVDRLYFDIHTGEANPALLERAATELESSLRESRWEIDPGGKISTDEAAGLGPYISRALPCLLTEEDYGPLERKLGADSIRSWLNTMHRKLVSMESGMVEIILPHDPLGVSGLLFEKWTAFQAGMGQARLQGGRLTSSDGCHALIWAEPDFPSSDSKRSAELVEDVRILIADIEQRYPDVRIAFTGGYRMSADNARYIRGDIWRCTLVSFISIMMLCALVFRDRTVVLAIMMPSLVGLAMGVLALTVGFSHVSAIAIGLASIAVGITVDYAIHVVFHIDIARKGGAEEIARHLDFLKLPLTLGALTTIAAFIVLGLSGVAAYRQLAVFGAAGVLVSALLSLLILPLAGFDKPGKPGGARWLSKGMSRLLEWRSRYQRGCLAAALPVSLVAAMGLGQIQFEGDVSRMNGITPQTRADEEQISSIWGEAMNLTMLVSAAPTLEEALRKSELAGQRALKTAPIDSLCSVSSLLPSSETQRKNIERWVQFWTPDRIANLKHTVSREAAKFGFREDAFNPFWQMLDGDPAPLTWAEVKNSPLGQSLQQRIAQSGSETLVSTLVKLKDRSAAPALRQALDNQAVVIDRRMFAEHIADLAREGLGRFTWMTALLVGIILLLGFGRFDLTIATLIPVAMGLLWTFGLFGWLDVPITPVNSVFVIFIIGIVEDYSLFFVTSHISNKGNRNLYLAGTGSAVTVSAATTLLGMAALLFARHPVLFNLGMTISIALLCSLVAVWIFSLSCADWLLARREQRASRGSSALSSSRRRTLVKARYDYQGAMIENFVFWKLKMDPLFKHVADLVPRQGHILDLGCGNGLAEHWLWTGAHQQRFTGVDADEFKIRSAMTSLRGDEPFRFECRDIVQWDYPAADAILLLDVLHYLSFKDKQHILNKSRQALTRGGSLIIRDSVGGSPSDKQAVQTGEWFSVLSGHHLALGPLEFQEYDELKAMLKSAGFDQIRIIPGGGRRSNVLLTAS